MCVSTVNGHGDREREEKNVPQITRHKTAHNLIKTKSPFPSLLMVKVR